MRRAASLVGLVGLGLLGGHAFAASIPVPVPTVPTPLPVPVPTVPTPVPVPAVPVPLPTVPELPAPVVAAPVKTSASAVSAPAVHAPAIAGSSTDAATASSYSSGSSTGSSSSGSSARAARPNVERLHASRSWIGMRGTKRGTTLTFVLPRAARVFFTVDQVSPVCRTAGHFSYRGHAGLNRVRFNGRVGGRQLEPGTYRISARTPGGRTIPRVTLVVVDAAAPTRAELAAARSANVCSATAGTASSAAGLTGGLALAEHLQLSLQPKGEPSASGAAQGSNSHSGVLAASLEKTAEALRPVIIALLTLAILLLAVASLPRTAVPDARLHDVLARHRVDLAGIGAAALVAVVLVFLLG